jgi:hypothetical protein
VSGMNSCAALTQATALHSLAASIVNDPTDEDKPDESEDIRDPAAVAFGRR